MIASRLSLLIAFAAGVGSAFAFKPAGIWPLMLVAIAMLCELLLHAATLRRAMAIGWLFGFGQFLVGLNWIATAFTYQAAMPAWLGWVAVLLVSLFLALFPMLAAGLAWKLGRGRRIALLLVLAGAWSVTEWLRAGLFTGFAWNPLGVVLVDTPLLAIGPLIGTYGLSGLVVLLGGALWLAARREWKAPAAILVATLLLWLVPAVQIPDGSTAIKPIRIVQPNIGQQDKWRPGFSEEAARRLAILSNARSGEAGPRLLFWPEAAVTEPLEDERLGQPSAFAEFERRRAATSIEAPNDRLLTGGIALHSSDGTSVDGAANSVFVLGPGGQVVGRYDKAHLVPYGEYLPMRPLLSKIGLSRLAPGDIDFDAGPGPRTLDLGRGWGKVGLQICYEIIFSGEVVDDDNRPDFIFNPSNDAWFGYWGPPQHLAQARLRAAEEGLPVVRSTPTGISALIDARGRVVDSIPWGEAGVIDAVLPPPARSPTPFGWAGNWLPLLIAFALLIAGIALGASRRYRHT